MTLDKIKNTLIDFIGPTSAESNKYHIDELFRKIAREETTRHKHQVNNKTKPIIIKTIEDEIFKKYGTNFKELSIRNRTDTMVEPRQVSAYILRINGLRLKEVGTCLKRHNSTVLHSIKTIDDRCDTEKNFKEDFMELVRITRNKIQNRLKQ